MKAHSASVTLYHMTPGHHRETAAWHDADHKAEVVGSLPEVFLSQRWVTPPDWIPLRRSSDLADGGGEYVNIYWSSGSAQDLERNFGELGAQLKAVGRMDPVKHMKCVWPTTRHHLLRPLFARARPGLAISGEAVTASTANTGLLTVIHHLLDDPQRNAYLRWHEAEYLSMVLETGLFAGVAKLALDSSSHQETYVTLLYTDAPSPKDAYLELGGIEQAWRRGHDFPGAESFCQPIFESLACPSIGRYDLYE